MWPRGCDLFYSCDSTPSTKNNTWPLSSLGDWILMLLFFRLLEATNRVACKTQHSCFSFSPSVKLDCPCPLASSFPDRWAYLRTILGARNTDTLMLGPLFPLCCKWRTCSHLYSFRQSAGIRLLTQHSVPSLCLISSENKSALIYSISSHRHLAGIQESAK